MLSLVLQFVIAFLALGVEVPLYALGIELSANSFTNVTSRVERADWGQSIVDMRTRPQPMPAMFELSNDDGIYSPKVNSSFRIGKALKLTATYSGTIYPLFFGRITKISVSPILGRRTTIVEAIDDWERVRRLTYTTSMFVNTPIQSLFCSLMSLSSVRSFYADSTIADRTGFAWYRDRAAENALYELVQSGNYSLFVNGEGVYSLRDRYWSLFNSPVGSYAIAEDLQESLSDDSVVNQAKIFSTPRQLTTSVQTLAYIPQPFPILAGQTVGFWLTFQDPLEASQDVPVSSLASLVSSTDYYASVGSDGTGTNLTAVLSISFTPFAASAVCSITNTGSIDGYLTRFQVRGYPIRRMPELATKYDVASSQSAYGVRTFQIDNSLIQDLTFMDGMARTLAAERKDGRDEAKHSLVNEFPDVLRNNPSDVYHLTDNLNGYVGLWRIRSIQHELSLTQGLSHKVTYQTETADNLPFLVLDSTAFGKLDAGRILAL